MGRHRDPVCVCVCTPAAEQDDAELVVPVDGRQVTPEEIASRQKVDGGEQLRPQDIIVDVFSLSYGMKNRNPVDRVRFFSDFGSDGTYAAVHEGGVIAAD